MANRTCSIEGCETKVRCRGLCRRHYYRALDADPLRELRRKIPELADTPVELLARRLAAHTAPSQTHPGCMEWQASRTALGYGKINIKQDGRHVSTRAHRIAWLVHHGPISDEMLVLHHCDNPPCVNVEHLYLGTHQDNMRDMYTRGRDKGTGRENRTKTHCPQGHPYSRENTYINPRGSRECRICVIERGRAYRARLRARS